MSIQRPSLLLLIVALPRGFLCRSILASRSDKLRLLHYDPFLLAPWLSIVVYSMAGVIQPTFAHDKLARPLLLGRPCLWLHSSSPWLQNNWDRSSAQYASLEFILHIPLRDSGTHVASP
ncbi:hypothetical protein K438DRAFT_1772597 [Mycena galopus ATCC 62051]|nr:hypothetical protein K438DRAFT_1772597 [Mycena galopus ATCC 62051]